MLDIAIVALSGETVEVGSGGQSCGIPEVGIGRDILFMEDAGAPLVVDVEGIDGIAHTFEEVNDNEAVVDAITIRGDHIGELEEVVDDEDGVGGSIGAVNHIARRCQVVSAGDETHTIGSRDLSFVSILGEVEGGIMGSQRLNRKRVVTIVLNLPEILVGTLIGLRIVNEVDHGVEYRGIDRFP